MLIIGASVGLVPEQVYKMTFREIECVVLGQERRWRRLTELLAFMTANLMNIHLSRGDRVKVNDLLPKDMRRQDQADAPAFSSAEDLKRFMTGHNEVLEAKKFWSSPEGQKLSEFLGLVGYDEEVSKED